MHSCFVYNMNRSAFVVCILVLTISVAAEVNSGYKSSSTTTKSYEATTPKWKEITKTNKWQQSTTKRINPTNANKWERPSTEKYQVITRNTKWEQYTPTTKWKYFTTTRKTPIYQRDPVNHRVVAVASIGGIDSRNGRLSPINSIEVYPPVDPSMIKTDNKGNFIFKSVDGKMPMPITITKQGDGVSGTIRILPGSVSVSSSASSASKSGPVSAAASFYPWPSFMMPRMNDIYFPPIPPFPAMPEPIYDTRTPDISFNTRILDPFSQLRYPEPTIRTRTQDPWINRNIYKQSQNKQDNIYKPQWYYPTFNPYMNFW